MVEAYENRFQLARSPEVAIRVLCAMREAG
jgi:hypothetical protein